MGIVRFKYCRMWAWQLSDYPQSVLQNGLGRYVCQLQRLTLHFCKVAEHSRGMRQFIENDLLDFANKNPGTVVYLHPHRWNAPFLQGEYLNGRKCTVKTSKFDRSEIQKWIEYLRTRSGQPIVRHEQHNRTETPSIQGIWNPFVNSPTEMNITQFPNETLGACNTDEMTATEILMKISKENKKNVKILQ